MRARFQISLLALATSLAPFALRAQSNQQAPQIVTLPDAGQFSLKPAQQSTPTPAPAPAPTPVPVPPPVVATVPVPSATPAVSRPAIAKPMPVPSGAPAPKPAQTVPKPVPIPVATPIPARPVSATPALVPTPAPQPTVAPAAPAADKPTAAAVPAAAKGSTPLPWIIGVVVLAALASGAFLLLRRRRRPQREAAAIPEPTALPARAPVSVAPPPPEPAEPVPLPVAATGPEVLFRPLRLGIGDQDALLDYELVVTNHGPGAMDDIKLLLGIISAQADQDQLIAAFHASAPLASGAPVFTLPAGASQRLPGRLTMRRETMLPVAVGGRPMIVPIALINLRWRQGLGIRSLGEAYMIGPEGEGGKLRPIWLDRGPGMVGPLSARLYAPEPQKQALAG